MPAGILAIKYKAEDDTERSYEFGVKQIRGGTGFGPPDAGFWADLIGPRMANGDFTWADSSYLGGGTGYSAVEALLRLLRGMMYPGVVITKAYLSDGSTPGDATGPFATIPLTLPCRWTYNIGPAPNRSEVAPANVTILTVKQPQLFGLRGGRNFIRFALRDEWVTYGAGGGAKLDNPTYLDNMVATWDLAIQNSTVRDFLDGKSATNGTVFVGQLQYYNKIEVGANPILEGVVKNVQTIASWRLKQAWGRQTSRGRKRPVGPAAFIKAAQRYNVVVNPATIWTATPAAYSRPNTGIVPPYDASQDDPANWQAGSYQPQPAAPKPNERLIDGSPAPGPVSPV